MPGQVEIIGKVAHVVDADAAPEPGLRQVTLVGGSGHGKVIHVGDNLKWINHYGDWYAVTDDTIAKPAEPPEDGP